MKIVTAFLYFISEEINRCFNLQTAIPAYPRANGYLPYME